MTTNMYDLKVPPSIRMVVKSLLSDDWRRRPSAKILAHPNPHSSPFLTPLIPFPAYFPILYDFLASFAKADWNGKLELTSQRINQICELEDEGFNLALPVILQLFSRQETRLGALSLFSKLATRLGSEDSQKLLLKPITDLFDSHHVESYKAALSNSFIDQLVGRLGLPEVLKDILPLIHDGLTNKVPASSQSTDLGELKKRVATEQDQVGQIPKLCSSSLHYLATLIGPVLTVRHITTPLLRKIGKEDASMPLFFHTLVSIGGFFGETFISFHYIPHLSELIEKTASRPNSKALVIIHSALSLLEKVRSHFLLDV